MAVLVAEVEEKITSSSSPMIIAQRLGFFSPTGVVPGFGPSVPSPQANLLYCVCLAAIRDRRLDLLTKIVVALEGQGPILENARDEAVKSGDADVVRALCVEGGCDVPSSRWLVKASELGHAEMVRALVELGSDPCAVLTQKLRGSRSEEQGAEEDVTALYVAAREGRRDVVKTLVELVSKTKERMDQLAELGLWLEFENTGERPDGRTPLEIALRNGHAETAKELIRAGATTGARIRHVHGLIRGPGQQEESVSTKVAHALAEYSFAGMVSKNTTVRGGRSEAFSGSRSVDLLALGLYHGWPLDSIRVLLEAGADPNRADIRAVGKARGDSSSSTAYTTNIISDTTSDAPPPILIAITHWAVPITEGASVRIITAGLQSGVAREFNPSTGCWEVDLALYEDDCVYVRDAVAVHPDDLCVISAVGGGGE